LLVAVGGIERVEKVAQHALEPNALHVARTMEVTGSDECALGRWRFEALRLSESETGRTHWKCPSSSSVLMRW
jgi:hypothetical protein